MLVRVVVVGVELCEAVASIPIPADADSDAPGRVGWGGGARSGGGPYPGVPVFQWNRQGFRASLARLPP